MHPSAPPPISPQEQALLLDLAHEAIFVWEWSGVITYWNQGAEELYGFSREEALGQVSHQLLQTVHSPALQSVEETLEREGRWHGRLIHTTWDGRALVVESRHTITTRPDGRRLVLECNRDVTEQVAVEAALRSSQAETQQQLALLQTLYASAPVGLAFLDRDLRHVQINDRLAAINGLPVAEHLGRTIDELLPDLAPTLTPLYHSIIESGQPILNLEISGKTPADLTTMRDWLVSYHPVTIAGGEVVGVNVVVQENTERKAQEAQLRASEERLRLFVEHAPAAVAMFDREMRYLVVSRRWIEDYQLVEPLVGRSHYEVFPELPERWKEIHRRCLAGAVERMERDLFERADGSLNWLRWEVRPWPDHTGAIGGIVVFTEDITVRVQAEMALQAAMAQEQAARQAAEEASRLKDEFLATVSHELRTPLTAFLGYAELLQRRKRDEEYTARTIQLMVQSARAQAVLIEDLLDIARIVSGNLRIAPQPIELIPVIQAALDTMGPVLAAKRLRITIDLDPEANALFGDATRLQQVIWNLLSNAAKFTPPGGRIGLRLAREGSDAVLTVSDSGQGIRPDFLPHVFERFRQADGSSQRVHGGLGLGLALVQHLVELHGGVVTAASPGIGQGATFIVRLPLACQAREAVRAVGAHIPPLESPHLSGLRVLLVDDQPAMLELLDEQLSAAGAIVRRYTSARAGLEALRSWRPDVLIADIAMPSDDGYWLIRQVRALPPDAGGATPALALTAYGRTDDRQSSLAAGFQEHLVKPVEAEKLRAAVARAAWGEERGESNVV